MGVVNELSILPSASELSWDSKCYTLDAFSVVNATYFDQRLGAAHSRWWSNNAFSRILHEQCKT